MTSSTDRPLPSNFGGIDAGNPHRTPHLQQPAWSLSVAPGIPTLVKPVRVGDCPVMNAVRPAVKLCCP